MFGCCLGLLFAFWVCWDGVIADLGLALFVYFFLDFVAIEFVASFGLLLAGFVLLWTFYWCLTCGVIVDYAWLYVIDYDLC